ncbi:MAG: hypothetical protein ACLR8P_08925 [Clostridium fessum]
MAEEDIVVIDLDGNLVERKTQAIFRVEKCMPRFTVACPMLMRWCIHILLMQAVLR